MPYPNEHAARLTDPGQYDRIRRENDKFGAGIHAIWGVKDNKAELQAIRFDKAKFSVEEAKKWLEEHKHKAIEFEPASESKHDDGGVAIRFADGDGVLFADAEGQTGWVEVFRAGAYPQATVKAEEVEQIARTYDPAHYEAPVSLDHQGDGPAFGWVGALRAVTGRLFARFRGLVPAFRDAAARFYPRRSIELYPPDHDSNPTPGGWALKAVSFLGVRAPQVKGLDPLPASFAADDSHVSFSLQEWKPMSEQTTAVDDKKFAEELKARDDEIKKLQERAKASDEAAKQLAERLAAETRTRILAEERQFCEGLAKKGALAPVAGMPELLVALRELPEAQVVAFAEADKAEVKKRPYDLFRAHLAGLKPVVALGEVAGDEEEAPDLPSLKGASDRDLAQKAAAFVESEKKAGRTVSFADALVAVLKK